MSNETKKPDNWINIALDVEFSGEKSRDKYCLFLERISDAVDELTGVKDTNISLSFTGHDPVVEELEDDLADEPEWKN